MAAGSMLVMLTFFWLWLSRSPTPGLPPYQKETNKNVVTGGEPVRDADKDKPEPAATGQSATPAELTQEQLWKIEQLRKDVVVPFDEIKHDRLKAFNQSSAMSELAVMQRPESIAALVSLLYAEPQDAYFYSNNELKSFSYLSLSYLSKVLEGVPPPTNGEIYNNPADIHRLREWWEANKNNLRFKQIPDSAK